MQVIQTLSILIADDDADDQFLIAQAISEAGITKDVKTVVNGLQLVDLLNCHGKSSDISGYRPDLVLLDLNMPVMDGLTALKFIRDSDHLKNVPVYVLSTSHARQDEVNSLSLGANGFYSKPVEFSRLKSILVEICSHCAITR